MFSANEPRSWQKYMLKFRMSSLCSIVGMSICFLTNWILSINGGDGWGPFVSWAHSTKLTRRWCTSKACFSMSYWIFLLAIPLLISITTEPPFHFWIKDCLHTVKYLYFNLPNFNLCVFPYTHCGKIIGG